MSSALRVVRLPDVGEGVAEAEIVSWHVAVGDAVTSDSVVAEVLTDKATVEIYAPVAGTVDALYGQAGDVLAVGSDFFAIRPGSDGDGDGDDRDDGDAGDAGDESPATPVPATPVPPSQAPPTPAPASPTPAPGAAGVAAAPAVRERARRLGIHLTTIVGTGPSGRVTHADLDGSMQRTGGRPRARDTSDSNDTTAEAGTKVPVIGLRRRIAERLTIASSRIPHITYVDEIDMTQLEQLRNSLASAHPDQPRVTVLPFLMRAMVLAVADQPQLNATFDDDEDMLTTFDAVHIGIATQTPAGLIVPVVRNVETKDLWEIASELSRVTEAARTGSARRVDLTGSTITITSLGALGGLVTTPIINHPEVAIVGVNKMQTRPVWIDNAFVPRRMMNLSSSFDHRIVDGWDCATFVQRIKKLLEEPAMLFVPPPTRA